MDASQLDELRSLRERAYGPDADIHDDPDAVARLRQLERGDVSPHDERRAPEEVPSEPAATTPVETLEPVADDEPQKQRTRPRLRELGLLVGSLVVAIAATAIISNATIQAGHTDPQNVDATEVAALSEDPFWEVPSFFGGTSAAESLGFEEFYGLRVVIATGLWVTNANDECIFVMTSVDADAATENSFGGQIFEACAAGSFPAEVTFRVFEESPEQLRQAFPDGTALQFVYDKAGGDVVVFRADAE